MPTIWVSMMPTKIIAAIAQPRGIMTILRSVLALLTEEEEQKMRVVAERYAMRREMDAEVDGQGRRWDSHGQEVNS